MKTGRWVVLNVAVTQVLGEYPTEQAATAAAAEFGGCSFPYELNETEAAAIDRIRAEETTREAVPA